MPEQPRISPETGTLARPSLHKAFLAIASKAREVLRERGLSEAQIEEELARARRMDMDD